MNEVVSGDAPAAITAPEWRQIVQSATDTAIISTDAEGRVTSWSEGARRILGWTEADMLGQTLDRLFTEEDRRRGVLAKEFNDAVKDGRGGGQEGWRICSGGAAHLGGGRAFTHSRRGQDHYRVRKNSP